MPPKEYSRQLSGHLFSAFMACPQRAWLDIHGNKKDRLASPVFLRALQTAGIDHEKVVEEHFLKGAVKIPGAGKQIGNSERLSLTRKAMDKGAEYILQAYIETEAGVGVIDVLEKVGTSSKTSSGYLYRVGEIKHACSLQTGHVFQTLWYRDLLKNVAGDADDKLFFITGNMRRQDVDSSEYEEAYRIVCKDVLLLQEEPPPGPHLCSLCPACSWRGVCMQTMTEDQDVSLLPCISRSQSSLLKREGIATWKQLMDEFSRTAKKLGLTDYQRKIVLQAAERIPGKGAVTKSLLDEESLMSLAPLYIEFSDENNDSRTLKRIVYRDGTDYGIIEDFRKSSSRLSNLLKENTTVVYGHRELQKIREIARSQKIKTGNEPVVLFDIVDRYVHEPLLGLELEEVVAHVLGTDPGQHSVGGNGERMAALEIARNWLAGAV